MKLKQLEVFGFKSFVTRTTVLLESGITAVVGPNGCGKTNIVDAVLWVMGEQSPKTLRGDLMEDVLFNGTEKKRPLSLAEVSLTLEEVEPREDQSLSQYREIRITRRLYRSGESEYLINKAPCRLRDVRDLLMDLGAGHKGHGIVEQGKVDKLIMASPNDRRMIIEETAGITKYKVRKAEAERKLEATNQNLVRVRDIIGEVRRQLNHLQRQVNKAQAFQGVQEKAQDLELRLSVLEGRSLWTQQERSRSELDQVQQQEAGLLARRSSQEAEIETLRTGLLGQQDTLEEFRQTLQKIDSQIQGADHRITAIHEQQADWKEQSEHMTGEIRALDAALEEARAQLDHQKQSGDTLQEERTQQQAALQKCQDEMQGIGERIQGKETLLAQLRRGIFEQQATISRIRNQVAEGSTRISEIQKRLQKADHQIEQLNQDRRSCQAILNDQTRTLDANRVRLQAVGQEHAKHQTRMETVQSALKEAEQALAGKREMLQGKKLQHTLLADQIQKHSNLQEGARGLLSQTGSSRKIRGLHGILADFMQLEDPYEKAVDAVLRERLGGLILEDHQAMADALDQLRREGAGEATLIPRQPRAVQSAPAHLRAARELQQDQQAVLGHALSFVRAGDRYQTLLEVLLGDVLIVQDVATARDLWKRSLWTGTLVTLAGEVLEPTGILLGRAMRSGPKGLLEQRSEVKALAHEVSELEKQAQAAAQKRDDLESELGHQTAHHDALNHQRHALELEGVELQKKFELTRQDLQRTDETLELLQMERQQAGEEQKEIGEGLQGLSEDLDSEESKKSDQESSQQDQQDALALENSQREEKQAGITQLQIALKGLQEKLVYLNIQQDQLRHQLQEQAQQREAKQQRLENLRARHQSSVQEDEVLMEKIQGLSQERTSWITRVQDLNETVSTRQERLKVLEEGRRSSQSELEAVQKVIRQGELTIQEIQLRLEHLQSQVQDLSRLTLEDAHQKLGAFELQEEESRARLERLKKRLETMGAVNLGALDEHREFSERYEFLTHQEKDLTESIDLLQKAITKINQTTRSLFMEAYEKLNSKFGEIFCQFFEGGVARLELLDPQNPLESGLEIVAQPPGKRLRTIQQLSGGEKALTAIALLFSSFLIHAAPFCILDEIDAPLDDENILRFIRMLKVLAKQSQFIIITHNKQTMEMADVLYGVTMEEPGCSMVVSVKMAQAVAQLA